MIETINSETEIENLYKTGSHAPYAKLPRGYFGLLGVLISRKKDHKVQCHICGNWYEFLSRHINLSHKEIGSKKYRVMFGFIKSFRLCGENLSRKRSLIARRNKAHRYIPLRVKIKNLKKGRNGKTADILKKNAFVPSQENKYDICNDQLKRRILAICNFLNGKFPSCREAKKYDSGALSAIERKYGGWNEFKRINFPLMKIENKREDYTDEKLFSLLKKFFSDNQRFPTIGDLKYNPPEGFPTYQTFPRRFGSYKNALLKAGFTKEEIQNRNLKYSPDQILFLLRAYVKKYKKNPVSREFSNPPNGYPSYATVRNYFGSWNRALMLAGLA